MALTAYEIPLGWVPDSTYINSPQGIQYLAWQIGVDTTNQRGFWLIEPVVDTPSVDLVDLLPVDYTFTDLLEDTPNYGYDRTAQAKKNIADLRDLFLAEIQKVKDAIGAGYR